MAIAPDDALEHIRSAINQPARRAFGVLKTQNEFVGVVSGTRFEIWERRQRAVHALGEVRPGEAGAQIVMQFVMSARTWTLLIVFCVLYGVAALGLATQAPESQLSAQELVSAIAGLALLICVFAAAAWRQRADLRAFMRGIFATRLAEPREDVRLSIGRR